MRPHTSGNDHVTKTAKLMGVSQRSNLVWNGAFQAIIVQIQPPYGMEEAKHSLLTLWWNMAYLKTTSTLTHTQGGEEHTKLCCWDVS